MSELRSSLAEELMFKILQSSDQALTLDEIVEKIMTKDPSALSGRTPKNSLYSIIYRREKRRIDNGYQPLFNKINRGGTIFYTKIDKEKSS